MNVREGTQLGVTDYRVVVGYLYYFQNTNRWHSKDDHSIDVGWDVD